MTRPGAAPRGGPGARTGCDRSLVHRIRAFQWSSAANRKCADCGEPGPMYICLLFQTFVCKACGDVHQGFGHAVKCISGSEWSVEELEALEAGGNDAARAWLASWSAAKFPPPDNSQADGLREFIRAKYVEKRWQGRPRLMGKCGDAAWAGLKLAYAAESAPLAGLGPKSTGAIGIESFLDAKISLATRAPPPSSGVIGIGSLLDTKIALVTRGPPPCSGEATTPTGTDAMAATATDTAAPWGTGVAAAVAADEQEGRRVHRVQSMESVHSPVDVAAESREEAQRTADCGELANGPLDTDFGRSFAALQSAQGFTLARVFQASILTSFIGRKLASARSTCRKLLAYAFVFGICLLNEVMSIATTAYVVLPILGWVSADTPTHPWALMLPSTVACTFALVSPAAEPLFFLPTVSYHGGAPIVGT